MARQGLIDWLNEQLYIRRVTGVEASKAAGLSVSAVSEIINGRTPGLTVCKALADYFGVPTEFVLRLAGHLPPMPQGALSPEAQADLGQVQRYVEMITPERQARLTDIIVQIAREFADHETAA